MVNGMLLKMCRDRIRRHIICRMLDRCKRIDLITNRQYNDTTWMLSGRPTHADAAGENTFDLTTALMYATLFKIFFHLSISSLIRQCTDRTCTERLPCTEDNLRIFMCLTLIIP